MRFTLPRLFFAVLVTAFALTPTFFVFAADFYPPPMVPCGWHGARCKWDTSVGKPICDPLLSPQCKDTSYIDTSQPVQPAEMCNFNDFIVLASGIVNGVVIMISVYAAISFMFAGYAYLTSGGNTSKVEYAKGIFYKVLIGYLVILTAWLIVYMIEQALFTEDMKSRSFLMNGKPSEVSYPDCKSDTQQQGAVAKKQSIDLKAVAVDPNNVALSWNQPSVSLGLRNVAITIFAGLKQYDVYRDSGLLASTEETTYKDTTVKSGETYVYQVRAVDNNGSVFAESNNAPVAVPEPVIGRDPARDRNRDPNCGGKCSSTQVCTYAGTDSFGAYYECRDKPTPPPPSIFTLSVQNNGEGLGSITSDQGGIKCGSTLAPVNPFPYSGSLARAGTAYSDYFIQTTDNSRYTGIFYNASCYGTSNIENVSDQFRPSCSTGGSAYYMLGCDANMQNCQYEARLNAGDAYINGVFQVIGTRYTLGSLTTGYSSSRPIYSSGTQQLILNSNGLMIPRVVYYTVCTAAFDQGTAVNLTATAAADSNFSVWGGNCSGTASCRIILNSNSDVSASFAKKQYGLNVRKSGPGSGLVQGGAINCGSNCSAPAAAGTVISLKAQADTDSMFAGWSGACTGHDPNSCVFPLNGDSTVTASFDPSPISCYPSSSSGSAISSATVGDTVVWVVANVPAGVDVAHYYWGAMVPGATIAGDITGEGQNLSSTFGTAGIKHVFGQVVYSDGEAHGYSCGISIVAAPQANLTIGMSGNGTGSVSGVLDCSKPVATENPMCSGIGYTPGARVSFTATPGSGSYFWGWTSCDSTSADGKTCYLTLRSGNNHIDAAFQVN